MAERSPLQEATAELASSWLALAQRYCQQLDEFAAQLKKAQTALERLMKLLEEEER